MRIEMPEIRKKYDREFREGAVRIVEETRKPIAQVTRGAGRVLELVHGRLRRVEAPAR